MASRLGNITTTYDNLGIEHDTTGYLLLSNGISSRIPENIEIEIVSASNIVVWYVQQNKARKTTYGIGIAYFFSSLFSSGLGVGNLNYSKGQHTVILYSSRNY